MLLIKNSNCRSKMLLFQSDIGFLVVQQTHFFVIKDTIFCEV